MGILEPFKIITPDKAALNGSADMAIALINDPVIINRKSYIAYIIDRNDLCTVFIRNPDTVRMT